MQLLSSMFRKTTKATGLCVQRLSDGSTFGVLIEYADGKRTSIDPEEYAAKKIQPDMEFLPTRKDDFTW